MSERVVSAVADAEGVSELELPPLARTIDPDALNALVESIADSPGSTGHVEFTYAGHAVTVTGDRQVGVRRCDA